MVGRNEGYGMNDEEERNRSEATREGNVEMIFWYLSVEDTIGRWIDEDPADITVGIFACI